MVNVLTCNQLKHFTMTQSRKAQNIQRKDQRDSKKFFTVLIIIVVLLMLLGYMFFTNK